MKQIKIMPCLDMKNGRVVKGVHFVDIRDAGDPVENAAFYEKEGADELAMLDIAQTLAKRFGSDKITVAIDARRNAVMPSGFELVVAGGTKPVGKDAIAWARQCKELGAGGILPTSMDGDGTLAGYDLEFTKAVADVGTCPA